VIGHVVVAHASGNTTLVAKSLHWLTI